MPCPIRPVLTFAVQRLQIILIPCNVIRGSRRRYYASGNRECVRAWVAIAYRPSCIFCRIITSATEAISANSLFATLSMLLFFLYHWFTAVSMFMSARKHHTQLYSIFSSRGQKVSFTVVRTMSQASPNLFVLKGLNGLVLFTSEFQQFHGKTIRLNCFRT